MSSVPIPCDELKEFTSGDYVQWSKTLTQFPSTDYTLKYQLRGPQEYTITAAVYQTSSYLVTLSASTTASYKAGYYSLVAFVTDIATELLRYSVCPRFPFLTVKENPAAYVNGSANNLTWAARTLAAVEQTIFQLSSRQVTSASVNGQSYNIQDLGKLYALRNRTAEVVRSEQDAINIKAGLGAKKNILVRFPPLNGGMQWLPGMTNNSWLPPGSWS